VTWIELALVFAFVVVEALLPLPGRRS